MKIKKIAFGILTMCLLTACSISNSPLANSGNAESSPVYTAEELMSLSKKGQLPETGEMQIVGPDSGHLKARPGNALSVKRCKEEVMKEVNEVKKMFPTKILLDKKFKFQAQMWMAEGSMIMTCLDGPAPLATKIYTGAKYIK